MSPWPQTDDWPAVNALLDQALDLPLGERGAWLALEHVQGRPLDLHARDAGLDTPARVRLLLPVCEAVAVDRQGGGLTVRDETARLVRLRVGQPFGALVEFDRPSSARRVG